MGGRQFFEHVWFPTFFVYTNSIFDLNNLRQNLEYYWCKFWSLFTGYWYQKLKDDYGERVRHSLLPIWEREIQCWFPPATEILLKSATCCVVCINTCQYHENGVDLLCVVIRVYHKIWICHTNPCMVTSQRLRWCHEMVKAASQPRQIRARLASLDSDQHPESFKGVTNHIHPETAEVHRFKCRSFPQNYQSGRIRTNRSSLLPCTRSVPVFI